MYLIFSHTIKATHLSSSQGFSGHQDQRDGTKDAQNWLRGRSEADFRAENFAGENSGCERHGVNAKLG